MIFYSFTHSPFLHKMIHIFLHVTYIIVFATDCGTSLGKKKTWKGEDGGVLRSPSCSQAISPKMPFSSIQSLLPGKHVEIGLMINWNECHVCFHFFHCSSVHALGFSSSQILGRYRKVIDFTIAQFRHLRSTKVAKRLGRSLENNQPLPKGIDADPECMAYVTWRGMVRWSHTWYRKKWLEKKVGY